MIMGRCLLMFVYCSNGFSGCDRITVHFFRVLNASSGVGYVQLHVSSTIEVGRFTDVLCSAVYCMHFDDVKNKKKRNHRTTCGSVR